MAITPNGTIQVTATPGPFRFTPDGTTLYFANLTSNLTGGSILQVTLANYTVAKWPTLVGGSTTPIDDVLVAGNGRIFAISYANSTLYDVATSPLSLQTSSLNSLFNTQAVQGVALSGEIPALYLYALVATSAQSNIYRITLANNQAASPVTALVNTGTLEYVGVPPQTGAGSFLQYNTNQTVAQGATSLPLIARVLDISGRPVFNLPVTFNAPAGSGFTISNPNPTTNADGYVQTTVVAPAAQGTYNITVTAGTANASYTINVPGVSGGGGGGGTVNQVTIVSGNGQLIQSGSTTSLSGNSLTILVTDVNGVPLQGVAATFAVTSGTGFIANPAAVTDANGHASADFVGSIPAGSEDFESDTVVASTAYGVATFTETEFAAIIAGSSFPAYPPAIALITPSQGGTVTVAEGAVAKDAVLASIAGQSIPQVAVPIPNVAISIVDPSNPNVYPPPPSTHAACKNGSTLSDATFGIAHCDLIALCGTGGVSAIGSWPVGFMVGGLTYFQGFVNVTPGNGQLLAIVSGNNQSGPAGSALQFPLVANVTDGCNQPISGAAVTWAVTKGSATLSNQTGTSVGGGRVSANVTFGSVPGPVTVTVSLGTTAVATFTLTANPVVSNMSVINGANQTTTINTAFTQPLTVQVNDANNNPIAGATVNFTVTSGNASINPTSAVTNANGQASTTATAAQTAGVTIVTATYASVSATFTLTAIPKGPVVVAANFQNAASFQTGLVPCGLATATGDGLAPGIVGTVSGASFFGPLQTTLNGLSLSVNGIPAPIYQLSNTNGKQQVTFQTPCEVGPSNNATVVIQLSGGTTTITGVTILSVQPGIFYSVGANNIAYGDVISGDDGSYVSATNPAKRGHTYYLIATGLGQVTPATATNSVGINGQNVAGQVIVGVDNLGVPVTSAYYQPGEVGVYVVGFTIPLTNPAGTNQPLALGLVSNGNTVFANTVYIPVVQ